MQRRIALFELDRHNFYAIFSGRFNFSIENTFPQTILLFSLLIFRSEPGRLNGTQLVAPHLNARADLVADSTRDGEALFACASERGGIGKTPMQALGHTSKDRATVGATLITDSDRVGEQFA